MPPWQLNTTWGSGGNLLRFDNVYQALWVLFQAGCTSLYFNLTSWYITQILVTVHNDPMSLITRRNICSDDIPRELVTRPDPVHVVHGSLPAALVPRQSRDGHLFHHVHPSW